MMIFDGVLGCATSVFILPESVCGRVRQSRTRRRSEDHSATELSASFGTDAAAPAGGSRLRACF